MSKVLRRHGKRINIQPDRTFQELETASEEKANALRDFRRLEYHLPILKAKLKQSFIRSGDKSTDATDKEQREGIFIRILTRRLAYAARNKSLIAVNGDDKKLYKIYINQGILMYKPYDYSNTGRSGAPVNDKNFYCRGERSLYYNIWISQGVYWPKMPVNSS